MRVCELETASPLPAKVKLIWETRELSAKLLLFCMQH